MSLVEVEEEEEDASASEYCDINDDEDEEELLASVSVSSFGRLPASLLALMVLERAVSVPLVVQLTQVKMLVCPVGDPVAALP